MLRRRPFGAPSEILRSKEDRWHSFSIEEVKGRDYKIDGLKWLKDESLDDADGLPEPEELATDAIEELEAAIEDMKQVLLDLERGNGSELTEISAKPKMNTIAVGQSSQILDDSDLPDGWVAVKLPDICELNPPRPNADALAAEAPVTFVPMPAVDAELGAITSAEIRPFANVRKGFTAFSRRRCHFREDHYLLQ